MRKFAISSIYAVLSATFLAMSGCATVIGTSTEFKAWRGDYIYQGKGGAVEVHNGVEFWEHGEPNKAYKVIGLVAQTKKSSLGHEMLFGDFNRGKIVKIVLREKGDGVVLMRSQNYVSGYSTNMPGNQYGSATTTAEYSEASVLAVFKYVSSNNQVQPTQ